MTIGMCVGERWGGGVRICVRVMFDHQLRISGKTQHRFFHISANKRQTYDSCLHMNTKIRMCVLVLTRDLLLLSTRNTIIINILMFFYSTFCKLYSAEDASMSDVHFSNVLLLFTTVLTCDDDDDDVPFTPC